MLFYPIAVFNNFKHKSTVVSQKAPHPFHLLKLNIFFKPYVSKEDKSVQVSKNETVIISWFLETYTLS